MANTEKLLVMKPRQLVMKPRRCVCFSVITETEQHCQSKVIPSKRLCVRHSNLRMPRPRATTHALNHKRHCRPCPHCASTSALQQQQQQQQQQQPSLSCLVESSTDRALQLLKRERVLDRFLSSCRAVCRRRPVARLLIGGFHPFSRLDVQISPTLIRVQEHRSSLRQ